MDPTQQMERKESGDLRPYKTYICQICGWVYDEAKGDEEEGFAPGTRWEDIPVNWVCPDCGARKDEFEMVEV